MDTKTPRLLIAAGGTGGHIYPAIAVAAALAERYPQIGHKFLCGERQIERELYAAAGVEPIVLPARQIGQGIIGRLTAGLAALGNTYRAMHLIRSGSYGAVLGMGGYVTGPAMLAGVLMRRHTIIHEANSIPGKTNRWIAPHVELCTTHFDQTAQSLRCKRHERVGMPIRASVTQGSREEGLTHFGLNDALRTLLVQGGSQGAKYLYETVARSLLHLDRRLTEPVQILWSTGKANYDELSSTVAGLGLHNVTVKLVPFIERTDLALAVSDAALSRAGASTMAELVSAGVYGLYVPLPSAIYDHQTLNAQAAKAAGAGDLLAERGLTPEGMADAIFRLLERVIPGRKMPVPKNLDSSSAACRVADIVAGMLGEFPKGPA